MSKYLNILTEKVYELYKTYESYAWKYDDRKIAVVFGKNNNLSFYLYEKECLVDDLHLSFDNKEYNLYKALCLRLFILIIGNVKIHKLDKDMYYNPKHKRYLLVMAEDENIRNDINILTNKQEKELLNFDIDIIKNNDSKVKKKIYSKKFLTDIDVRTKLLREMLRR